MPITNEILSNLMDRANDYESIIASVRDLFLKDVSQFNRYWYDDFKQQLKI